MAAEVEPEECAICLEPCAYNTVLPCRCKVSYCMGCWDKALAASLNTCGLARCPTCRSPVRVDYDADAGRLVFSKDDEGPLPELGGEGDEASCRRRLAQELQKRMQSTVERLLAQAWPAQVQRLRAFGAERPYLQELARRPEERLRAMPEEELDRCLAAAAPSAPDDAGAPDDAEAAHPAPRLLLAAGGAARVPGLVASVLEPAPPCVCGSPLQFGAGSVRIRKATEQRFPHATEEEVDRIFGKIVEERIPFVMCDLCTLPITVGDAVWTCESNTSTILHATSYDVCDTCFLRYACSWEAPQAASRPPNGDEGEPSPETDDATAT